MKTLPTEDRMYQAIEQKDPSFAGVFFVAVRTTGVFCRPGCPARCPKRENVEFFADAKEALYAGYRPCLRCRPLEAPQQTPEWVQKAMALVDSAPDRRVTEHDLQTNGLSPERLRKWFQQHHGMTFQSYQRGLRLGRAMKTIKDGSTVIEATVESGWDSTSGFREAFQRAFGTSPSRADGPVFNVARIETPLGAMVAVADEHKLYLLEFVDRRMMATQMKTLQQRYGCSLVPGDNELLDRTREQLREYFAGERRAFDVPLDFRGTPFQVEVWERLLKIGYGETLSYAQMARDLGRPEAQRAVGKANGDNRIAILVPCHRVIKADGSLCGYGGGLWRKRRLLELEQGQGGLGV
jgi:AraC family transcriptional regulator of adaptative response/methylated-DNA-[protein]-cysteine methyltransferase